MSALHPVMQAALAPWSPPPAADRLNDDDTYVVDLLNNRVVRRCSSDLLRAGGSIPVGLGQAVLTGMQARNRIAYEAERRSRIGKPSESLPPEYMLAKLQLVMPLFQDARDALTAITEQQRKAHGISASLAERMDEAGTFSLDDWTAAKAGGVA